MNIELVKSSNKSPLFDSELLPKMLKLAEVMAESKTMPAIFHNKRADCLRIIDLAYRINQCPFAVADFCFFVSGRLSMEGKGVAAIINASPKIIGSLHYNFNPDRNVKDTSNYLCTVSGTIQGESEPRQVSVSLALGMSDAKGAESRWKKDPDQMLIYYGARVWARRFAPEVIAGLYTPEELKVIPGSTIDREYRTVEEIDEERTSIVDSYRYRIQESIYQEELMEIYKEAKKEWPEYLTNITTFLSERKEELIEAEKKAEDYQMEQIEKAIENGGIE